MRIEEEIPAEVESESSAKEKIDEIKADIESHPRRQHWKSGGLYVIGTERHESSPYR